MEALVALGPSTQGHDHPLNGVALDAVMSRTQVVPVICIGRRRCCETALAHVCRQGGAMHALAAQVCGTEFGEDVVREAMLALWRDPEGFEAGRYSRRGFLLAQAHAVEVVHKDALRRRCASATVVRFTTREAQRWTSR